jgi:hypothetical protein
MLTIVICMILRVPIGGKRPYCVLKTHGRFHVRRRIESLEVTSWVDDRGKLLLLFKEKSIAILCLVNTLVDSLVLITYRSSIISKGGSGSNTPPRSISSPFRLELKSPRGCADGFPMNAFILS